jgi:hypothetical protein
LGGLDALNSRYAIGVLAIIFDDRDILPWRKPMLFKPVGRVIVLAIVRQFVVESPTAAWAAPQMAALVFATVVKADHGAIVAKGSSSRHVEGTIRVEWRDDRVANSTLALRMTWLARQFQTNAPKCGGQGADLIVAHTTSPFRFQSEAPIGFVALRSIKRTAKQQALSIWRANSVKPRPRGRS